MTQYKKENLGDRGEMMDWPDERWRAIAAMMELGVALTRGSPRRQWIEQRMAEQEEEWRRIQKELFARHGQ